jgi:hypothetical protein
MDGIGGGVAAMGFRYLAPDMSSSCVGFINAEERSAGKQIRFELYDALLAGVAPFGEYTSRGASGQVSQGERPVATERRNTI